MVEMNDAVDDSDDDADYTKMDMVWPFIILMGIKRAHIYSLVLIFYVNKRGIP